MDQDSQALLAEVKKLNKNLTKLTRSLSYGGSLLRGILSGLGSVLGATIVVALLVYLLRNVDLVPVIGDWMAEIAGRVVEQLPSGQL